MKNRSQRISVFAVLGLALLGAAAEGVAQPTHTEADVRFMQHMIVHHEQALVMAALVPSRTTRSDIIMLARRIEVAQTDEIALIEQWLERRGEPVARVHAHDAGHAEHAHHAGHTHDGAHAGMPGMLGDEELARLAAASGEEFDRLLLEYMIRHHEGALVMVAELFATPGAGQDTEIFRFASDVDADQRIEIERMRRMQQGSLQ
jgi:uncharacterized protein (DUF305 family)